MALSTFLFIVDPISTSPKNCTSTQSKQHKMVSPLPLPSSIQFQLTNLQSQPQSLSINSALTLSLLTSLGGVIGYARTGSIPSIAAGLSVGALYMYSYSRLRNGETLGEELSLLASVVLGGSSVPRAIKTGGKLVPVGLSILATYGVVVFGKEVLGKRA